MIRREEAWRVLGRVTLDLLKELIKVGEEAGHCCCRASATCKGAGSMGKLGTGEHFLCIADEANQFSVIILFLGSDMEIINAQGIFVLGLGKKGYVIWMRSRTGRPAAHPGWSKNN